MEKKIGENETVTVKSKDIDFATDGISQPVYFADAVKGTMGLNGVVRLNFVQVIVNPKTKNIEHKHVVTIAMPQSQLEAVSNHLKKTSENLIKTNEEMKAKLDTGKVGAEDGGESKDS